MHLCAFFEKDPCGSTYKAVIRLLALGGVVHHPGAFRSCLCVDQSTRQTGGSVFIIVSKNDRIRMRSVHRVDIRFAISLYDQVIDFLSHAGCKPLLIVDRQLPGYDLFLGTAYCKRIEVSNQFVKRYIFLCRNTCGKRSICKRIYLAELSIDQKLGII